jgi:hypothetical protein
MNNINNLTNLISASEVILNSTPILTDSLSTSFATYTPGLLNHTTNVYRASTLFTNEWVIQYWTTFTTAFMTYFTLCSAFVTTTALTLASNYTFYVNHFSEINPAFAFINSNGMLLMAILFVLTTRDAWVFYNLRSKFNEATTSLLLEKKYSKFLYNRLLRLKKEVNEANIRTLKLHELCVKSENNNDKYEDIICSVLGASEEIVRQDKELKEYILNLEKEKCKCKTETDVPFPKPEVLKTTRSDVLIFRKNIFGNYENPETKLVTDRESRVVVGKQERDGSVSKLNEDEITFCQVHKLEYKLPEQMFTRRGTAKREAKREAKTETVTTHSTRPKRKCAPVDFKKFFEEEEGDIKLNDNHEEVKRKRVRRVRRVQ